MEEPAPGHAAHTLANALAHARARLFVGREDLLAQLEAVVESDSPRRVVSLYGPGGAGKTELLGALIRRAERRGIPVVAFSGDELAPTEAALLAATGAAADQLRTPESQAAGARAVVILAIDGFEHLASLERWMRERLLPSLDSRVRVVLAGRTAPSPEWAKHPTWRLLHVALPLPDLSDDEARDYLTRRGLPAARHSEIVQRANGHPLALALLADLVDHDPDTTTQLSQHPQTVQLLLTTLVDTVPDDRHRDALWSMALMRRMTEDLLGVMIDPAIASLLFSHLQRLSFVRITPAGLTPHELVRELLLADLDWRAPGRRRALLERAARHFRRLLERSPDIDRESFHDISYLWRDQIPPTAQTIDDLRVSAARPEDLPVLRGWIERFQGKDALALFEHWCANGADVVVVRGADEHPRLVAVHLWLDRIAPQSLGRDPAIAIVARHADPTSPGHYVVRWELDGATGEVPSSAMPVLHRWEFESVIAPGRARRGFGVWQDPAIGLAHMPPGMLVPLPDATFELDGRTYQVIGTNERGQPLMSWFTQGLLGAFIGPDTPERGLDRIAFDHALRDLLKAWQRPEQLARSPLAQTALVNEPTSGELDTAHALRRAIEKALDDLVATGGDASALMVVRRTYLTPPTKQESLAIELGMSFSTYRRRLAAGTTRLADLLWLRATA